MRIGVYPFASTGEIKENLRHIARGIELAASARVELLAFHECALCGYPPIETKMEHIHPDQVQAGLAAVAQLAQRNRVAVAIGSVRFEGERAFNSMLLFNKEGKRVGCYDKTALWGWDVKSFARGSQPGIWEVGGVQVGFRICFDIRFPESFRPLYRQGVKLCFVSFSDTASAPDQARYGLIQAHLMTRAMENLMTVASVNSLSRFPTAPTAIFDPNGYLVKAARREELLLHDYAPKELSFGMQGRVVNNDYFLNAVSSPTRVSKEARDCSCRGKM